MFNRNLMRRKPPLVPAATLQPHVTSAGALQPWVEGVYTANRDDHPPFNPNNLYVGQELWIGCKIVKVKAGDTVRSIAQENDVPWQYVVDSNDYGRAIPLDPPSLTIIEWP